MKTSKLYTLLLAVLTALTLLSAAIAVPILCRPFYYVHIGPLELVEKTGLTEGQIRTAYNEMMDFCLGGETFSTGVLAWSESGKSHFEDVRALFLLDLRILAVCAPLLAAALMLGRRKGWTAARPLGRGPGFWAGTGLAGVFLLIGALAALDFSRAFTTFHTLFFPGKTNWIFDHRVDEIINILPMAFFRNCAILILAILVGGCALLIALDLRRGTKAPHTVK